MKPLRALVEALRQATQLVSAPDIDVKVSGVSEDSRRVVAGGLFCAVAGTVEDGHRYVEDARGRGAAVAVVIHPVDSAIPQVVVRDGRVAASVVAREWFGRPADDLRVIGVTGTNGKTTTVAILKHLLNAARDAGSIGTLGAFDGLGTALQGYGNLTTPGAVELHGVLAALRDRGASTVVMEASSHALDQRRLETLRLAAAVYTNLSHEHLDYHPSLDAYRDAKAKLSDHLHPGGIEVVNEEDPAWLALPQRSEIRRISYGRSPEYDVEARDVELRRDEVSTTLVFAGRAVGVRCPLLGDFNVQNALAASAAAWALGVDPSDIARALATVPQVAGRMELLASGPASVLRDYCHTPDALERAIAALTPLTAGRLIVVFGAGGDRDRSKRPLMGQAVARAADVAIVTSDNPRTEDPERIIDDIESGMEGTSHVRICDRREAIRHALVMVEPGDVVLLAGKGHETYQEIGTTRVPFDELEVVRELMGAEGHE
jgi:UDP-N-acetylmuramoyl-L-alanyl-D-glutamate--2,6-diaminopimelate ligase